MQPRSLLILLVLLPLLTLNGSYLLSAFEGSVPWCIPYLDGCTTISRAARGDSAIFLFRVTMIAYALLLICFWIYARHWLKRLEGSGARTGTAIAWLGVIGALAMMVYVDFLGTSGEINRFMRRHGIMLFFTLTPLAQLLLYREHLRARDAVVSRQRWSLRFQLFTLVLMLLIALLSIASELTETKTYASENIVEWNFSLLMNLYFIGMLPLWRDFRISFSR